MDPLLVTRKAVARLFDIPDRTLCRLEAAGHIPGRVVIASNTVRYRLSVIKRWVEAGCPPAHRWENQP